MNQGYRDIIDKLGEPQWWDEYAVPRYCQYHPCHNADIYADMSALVEIGCQNCGRKFLVAFSVGAMDDDWDDDKRVYRLKKAIEEGWLHYGDPPNISCCPSGPSMNCEDYRVVEFWERNLCAHEDWHRNPEFEIELKREEDE